MKNIEDFSEEIYKNNPVHYKREPLERLFKAVISQIRKCKGCRENKGLEKALNALMKRVLYTKRKEDK